MPTISVNGIEIAYEDAGAGAPVMLLTGLAGAGRAWGAHRERFAAEFRTVTPDHRGTGGSTRAATGYTIGEHARDMADLLRSLDTGPAHLVGSSTGGAIAQVMALDHPDVVRSISLVSSWAGPDPFFDREFASRKQVLATLGGAAYLKASALFLFAPSFTSRHPDVVDAWIEKASQGGFDEEIMTKRIDMIVAHDERSRLGTIDVPTLVVVGEEDICTPPHLSRELAALIPDARFALLDGGHLVYNEDPDGFFETVAGFIRHH
jgi:aminoacrylate hydrolase